ncbi:MAG: UDP-N-acetylmuramoylalanine--D-glutamate ligase [Paenibacillaceae bacterium]|jgi:UDP-N-acetylmuramoylalanine--D-glutamate ligase|nr:UDP-N-acetylmuramoylalanine--D-glutamate ligase [Paenibacillaceae bacterium]
MNHPRDYRGKKVIVLGLARSGVAVAKLFHTYEALVLVNDRKDRQSCPEADELESLGISVICGSHPSDLIDADTALIVKNPGIPYSIDPLKKAAELGLEVVTEVEVAWHICPAPIIGITGSNGKTTTTTWIGRILEEQGLQPIVAGNIGVPLCEAAQEAEPDNKMVIELSSFQLKGTRDFRPRIACLLNVYETHLDYHGTMEDYIESKAKLFANQTPDDIAVLNEDDEACRRLKPYISARIFPFSYSSALDYGVYLEAGEQGRCIVYRDHEGSRHEILPTSQLGIPGEYNIENAMAAAAVAIGAGASTETIARVLQQFRGVEHRLEFVASIAGVDYFNNSKATNAVATVKAIEGFDRPVVLIAGGLERGLDFRELAPFFTTTVKALVTLGETREKLAALAREAGLANVKTVDTGSNAENTLDEAVKQARAFAEPGDVVLLSPACASWDMFESYEERGSMFKRSVHNL